MKKLIIFAGALLLLAAGTAGFFANRPMSAQEALILRNVEALARGEIDEFIYKIEKDECKITVTADMDLKKLGDFMQKIGLGTPSIGMSLDLTDLTRLYSPGGSYRLGEDVTCGDLF